VESKTFNNHLGFERGLWQHQSRRFVVVPKTRVTGKVTDTDKADTSTSSRLSYALASCNNIRQAGEFYGDTTG
jgi:sarcosine oxidase delta subunit